MAVPVSGLPGQSGIEVVWERVGSLPGEDALGFYDFSINALSGAAAAAEDSEAIARLQTLLWCSNFRKAIVAAPVHAVRQVPPWGRAVWRSCAWRAARGGSGPWFAKTETALTSNPAESEKQYAASSAAPRAIARAGRLRGAGL